MKVEKRGMVFVAFDDIETDALTRRLSLCLDWTVDRWASLDQRHSCNREDDQMPSPARPGCFKS